MEWLEERQLLTWVATFVNATGTLTVQGVGLSSDTGALKVDPNSGEIMLDGNNSGNFVDTGANLATISNSIQIQANTTINSNFIIDNNAGAFFEAPANFPALTPLFTYTGSTAFEPNSSLTIRGQTGINDTFTVTPDATVQNMGAALLTQPPNQLNQQNALSVNYSGVSGHLTLDGIDGAGGNDQVIVNDPATAGTSAASNWTLNGNEIAGPKFPAAPTVPPTPPPLPGTIGDITYANVATLQFNNNQSGDLLTINSVSAVTNANDVGTTVVNYNQPLAFPVSLSGLVGGAGILSVGGALGGNNDFYIDAQSVSLAPAGFKPQYNVPFTHVGADLTYTQGSLKTLQVAGNGGNNTFTVQVPPVLIAPYTSATLPASFQVFGGALPPPALLVGAQPVPVALGTNLLRVLGNDPGATTAGADNITVSDLAGTATTTGAGIQMSNIQGVVIYGEGGNDTLTNASKGNTTLGTLPVPALLIGGDGNDTLTGGAGNDMLLGGNGQNTLVSTAVSTQIAPTTTYFFPHQDQFGNIFDPLLNPSVGNTASTITGTGGNQVVVTGAVDPALSITGVGDLDLGNLANAGLTGTGGGGSGNTNGGSTNSIPTVPPGNVTAPLYQVTPALTALEQAIGEGSGPFAPNQAALLEFGAQINLRGQFATFAAFTGRAYNDFLLDRGGTGTFGGGLGGGAVGGGGNGNNGGNGTGGFGAIQGASVVSPQEIQYWVSQSQLGLSVPSMQAQILASGELRNSTPGSNQWARFLFESVLGRQPTNAEITAYSNVLSANDTAATRYALALGLLTSPTGQSAQIADIYKNVVSGSPSPSPTDVAAIQADLAAGETLPQVAQTVSNSGGNYFSYENANHVGFVGFIGGVYQSVLHRPASAGDLNYWAGVGGQGVPDAQIALTILNSAEARTFVIQNAYQTYLGRPADAVGMNYWQSLMAAGLTDEQFASYIIASPEYYLNHGGTSSSYVRALYHDVLGRSAPPSQQEVDYWVSQLAMSTRGELQARADIAVAFQQSDEFRTILIDRWYQAFDGRAPSAAEVNAALNSFYSGASQEGVEAQILAARQTA